MIENLYGAVYKIEGPKLANDYRIGDLLGAVVDPEGSIIRATLHSGTLPAGVELNATTGELSINDPDAPLVVDTDHQLEIRTVNSAGQHTFHPVTLRFLGNRNALVTVLPPRYFAAYEQGDMLAFLSDYDSEVQTVTEAVGNPEPISNIGLGINARLDIEISDLSTLLSSLGTKFTYDAQTLLYSYDFSVDVTDAYGVTNTVLVPIRIKDDSEAGWTAVTPKLESLYEVDDELILITDEDGELDTVTEHVSNPVALSVLGMHVNDSKNIAINNLSSFLTGLLNTSAYTLANNIYSYTFDLDTTDVHGGISSITVTLEVKKDQPATATVAAAKHEAAYILQEEIVTFSDPDGPIAATAEDGSNPVSIFSLGMGLNASHNIVVDDLAEFRAGLLNTSAYSLSSGVYSYSFGVTTTDDQGGVTQHQVNLQVNQDEASTWTQVTPKHEDSYQVADELITFSDPDGAIENVVESGSNPTDLTSIGLHFNVNHNIAIQNRVTFQDALENSGVFSVISGKYTYEFNVETTDAQGGKTNHLVKIEAIQDTPATYTRATAINEDALVAGLLLGSIVDDTDGGIDTILLLDENENVLDLSTLGLVLQTPTVGGKVRGEIDIQNLTTFNQELSNSFTESSTEYAFNIKMNITDASGGTTEIEDQIIVLKDQEASYSAAAARHEATYMPGEEVITFDDDDGAITSVTENPGNPLSLATIGLTVNAQHNIAVIDSASFRAGLLRTEIYSLSGSTYTGSFSVDSTDASGGTSPHNISLSVIKDTPATHAIPIALNQDAYVEGSVLVSFSEPNDEGVALVESFASLDPDVPVDFGTIGCDFVETDSGGVPSSQLEIVDEEKFHQTFASLFTFNAGPWNYTYSFFARVTDAPGGTTDIPITLTIEADHEATFVVTGAKHEVLYVQDEVIVTFNDAEGAIADAIESENNDAPLSFLGLHFDSNYNIAIRDVPSFLNGLSYSAYEVINGKYTYTFDVTTIDVDGGKTDHTITIEFVQDSEATFNPSANKNEDAVALNDELGTVTDDVDGGISSITYLNTDDTPLNLSTIGVISELQNVGGKDRYRLRIDNETTYRASWATLFTSLPFTYQFDFKIETTDVLGASTEIEAAIVVDKDMESVVTPTAIQHEASYTLNQVMVNISDADGAITTVTPSITLSTIGMHVNGQNHIAINNLSTFRSALPTEWSLAGTTYSKSFSIDTVDADGGLSTHPVTLEVKKDTAAVFAPTPAINQDAHQVGDILGVLSDDIDIGVVSATFLQTDLNPLDLEGLGLNAISYSVGINHRIRLEIGVLSNFTNSLSSDFVLNSGTYELDFVVDTTDQYGGTTRINATISVLQDQETTVHVEDPAHESSYVQDQVMATFSDLDGDLTEITVPSFDLNLIGMRIEGVDQIAIDNIAVFQASIVSAEYWTLAGGLYSSSFTVDSTDDQGGQTSQSVTIEVTADTEAVFTPETPKNEDNYALNDLIASIADDQDDGLTSITYLNTDDTPLDLSTLGLISNMVDVAGKDRARITIDNHGNFLSALSSYNLNAGTYSYDIKIETQDRFGGRSTIIDAIEVLADTEASLNLPAAKHESNYSNGNQLAYFTDADGAITSATLVSGSVPGSSFNTTTGEITVSNAGLIAGGTYPMVVDTVDNTGGKTNHNFNIVINPDVEATAVETPKKHEDEYVNNEVMVTFSDADGSIASVSTSITLSTIGMHLNGSNNIAINNLSTFKASLLTEFTLTSGTYSKSFTADTTDDKGGQTNHSLNIEVTKDTEATYSESTAVNEDSHSVGDVLATYEDDTDNGIASAEILDTGQNALDLTTLGMIHEFFDFSGKQRGRVKINNLTTFNSALTSSFTLNAGTYSYDFLIDTTDEKGGQTRLNASVSVLDDSESSAIVPAAQHEALYVSNYKFVDFSDTDGTITSVVPSINLNDIGMDLDGNNDIIINDINAFRASLGGAIFELTAGTYSANFSVTTDDDKGGQTVHNLTLDVTQDSLAIYTPETVKNEDDYALNDLIGTIIDDTDGGIASVEYKRINDAPLDLSTLGLQSALVDVGGNNRARITIANLDDFLAALGSDYTLASGTYTFDFKADVTDDSGGTNTIIDTFDVDADTESSLTVPAAKHESNYSNGNQLAFFTDADGAITSATLVSGSVPGSSFNTTTGEITVSNAGLIAAGTYPMVVDTVDNTGGKTNHSFNIVINPDVEATAVETPKKHEDEYVNNEVMVTFSDADGTISSVSTSITLSTIGMHLNGSNNIAINNLSTFKASLLTEFTLTSGTYSKSFTADTTDNQGGQTNHNLTIEVIKDTEATYSESTAVNEDSHSVGDVLATYQDDTDNGIASVEILDTGENALDLATLGMIHEFFDFSGKQRGRIKINNLTTFITALGSSFTLNAGTYSYDFLIDTTDEKGGQTRLNASVSVLDDSESSAIVPAAQHEALYVSNYKFVDFSDTNGTITSVVPSINLNDIGMDLDGNNDIIINDINAFRASLGGAIFELTAGTYSANFSVTTDDDKGGQTVHNLTLDVTQDSLAIYTPETVKNEDDYALNDLIGTIIDDTDGGIASVEYKRINDAPLDLSTLGLQSALVDVGGNNRARITIANLDDFLSALGSDYTLTSGTYTFDFKAEVTDDSGGTNTIVDTFDVDADTESSLTVPAAKHESNYSNGNQLAYFTDADGAITSATLVSGSVPGSSFNTTTGEITVSNAGLIASGTYPMVVDTVDNTGGKTNHSFNIVINPDVEATAVETPKKHEDEYVNNEVMVTFSDADGTISSVSTSITLSTIGMHLNGSNNIAINNLSTFKASLLTEFTLTSGTYSKSFTADTTDNQGGQTNHSLTIEVTMDTEATYTQSTAVNEDSHVVGDVLATFEDDADGGISSAESFDLSQSNLDLSTLGMELELFDFGGTQRGRIKIINISTFTGALTSSFTLNAGTYSYDFLIDTTDTKGGQTQLSASVSVLDDSESSAIVPAAQHEELYSTNYKFVDFSDADGTITSVTPTINLNDIGMDLDVNNDIEITDINAFKASLGGAIFELSSGIYSANFSVTTEDDKGGQTVHNLTLEVKEDSLATYSPQTVKNEDDYALNDIIGSIIDDTDGGVAVVEYKRPNDAPLDLSTLGLESTLVDVGGKNRARITISNLDDFLAALETSYTLASGTYTFDFKADVTDDSGGTNTIVDTFDVDADTESSLTVPAAKHESNYSNGNQLAYFTDADGTITSATLVSGSVPGSSFNTTTGEVTVSNAALIAAGTYPMVVDTVDSTGGKTNHSFNIVINADVEATVVVTGAKHEDEYVVNAVMATFSDADGSISSATASITLSTIGMHFNASNNLAINNLSTFKSSLSTQFTLTSGVYSKSFTVDTTDDKGGETTHNITIDVNQDKEATVAMDPVKYAADYNDDDRLGVISDPDGDISTATSTTNLSNLGLGITIAGTPKTADLMVSDATTLRSKLDTDFTLTSGVYSKSITVDTTDVKGGTTAVSVTIDINEDIPDNEAEVVVEAAGVYTDYRDEDLLATVTDADDGIVTASVQGYTSQDLIDIGLHLVIEADEARLKIRNANDFVNNISSDPPWVFDEENGQWTWEMTVDSDDGLENQSSTTFTITILQNPPE